MLGHQMRLSHFANRIATNADHAHASRHHQAGLPAMLGTGQLYKPLNVATVFLCVPCVLGAQLISSSRWSSAHEQVPHSDKKAQASCCCTSSWVPPR